MSAEKAQPAPEPSQPERLASFLGEVGERIGEAAATVIHGAEGAAGSIMGNPERSAVERADALVSGTEEKLKGALGQVSLGARRILSRAREEAEDIWAEAKARRTAK